MLPDIITLLGSLRNALTELQTYDSEFAAIESLESALAKLYGETFPFCARTNVLLRSNPEVTKKHSRWMTFNDDIAAVIGNIPKYSKQMK